MLRSFRGSIRPFVAACVLALVAGAVLAQDAEDAQRAREVASRLEDLRRAAADRDAAEAERLLPALLSAGPGAAAADEGRLLVGKTLLLAGRSAAAVAAVDPIVERPESAWHLKALYLVAEAGARERDWKRAADIYAQRVGWAASDERRGEVAALYREIADGAFEGHTETDEYGREKVVRDHRTALDYYWRARSVHDAEASRALTSYRIGLCALETGNRNRAVTELQQLLAGERGDPGEWADEALYALGRALLGTGDRAGARAAFTELREKHGDSELAPLALRRIGETWFASSKPGREELDRVVRVWNEFLRLYPEHDEAPDVAWAIGLNLEQAGQLRDAAAAFATFVERFGDHERAPGAQYRVAAAHLRLREFDEAVAQWRALLARWPDDPLWPDAQRRIAAASFEKGEYAFERKQDADARSALEAFLEGFPLDASAARAQALLGELEARAEKHAEAVEAWRLTATKYPKSAQAPAAVLRIASTYEGTLADLEQALAAYEEVVAKWPSSAEAGKARGVLEQMKAKDLTVFVRRAFRTDEKPVAKMTLRNVDRLRMKAYRIDAADYVRRKGGLGGVERVEVDVVKPDHAWDWETPDFERYRLLERDCPLPFGEPGAYIVTAAEEDLTATLLVVISDLTAIVKSSPQGGLVFVYDERTGKPVAGAEVRVLEGDLRGVTGSDGVWREDGEPLPRMRTVVTGTGTRAGHFAYAAAQATSASAFGYTTKVYLQTDRPLYRGGQTVHLRGIVRRVAKGAYVTEGGLEVPLTVTDPRGAALLEGKLETDEYGVISRDLTLAAEPALGEHRVSVTLDGRTFTQSFEVLAFRKPDLLLTVEPERATYLAGDKVKAEVSAAFAVGGAAAGANARWTVFRGPFTFDASLHEAFAWFFRDPKREEALRRRAEAGTVAHARGTGVTDADGTLEIEFATDAVDEDRTYTIVVETQDPNRRWASSSAAVPVTRKGVYVICRTEKKVYRPGETMRLEITAVNSLHVPLETDGRALLVRRRRVDEHWVEDEVAGSETRTDAAGRALVELAAPTPGEYVAKFVTRDARGTKSEGASPVTVSGEAEDLAKHARLVADREFYREGDVARVLVNVPSAPVPVLLTYEGERVLEHRVFMATQRSNTLELPLTAEHAPNVFLRMAVAKDGKLHEDGDEVAVFQYLDVAVTAEPAEARPGDTVTLRVRTTDQSGKPVRATVGVDVVDETIYQLSPDRTPQIKPFFYDQRRTHAVRTASSAGLALPSVTRPTNKDLLFEQMRRLGRERFEKMQEHVRLGREYMKTGAMDKAREEIARALVIAPGSHEARALKNQLDRLGSVLSNRDGPPPTAGASPRPRLAARPEAEKKSKDVIGIGGGAGGAFGGRRGGRRNLRAGGGGKAASKGGALDEDLAVLDDVTNGIFDKRTQQVAAFKRVEGLAKWAVTSELQQAVLAVQAAVTFVAPELRQRFEDTAFSSPGVRTDDGGEAELRIELPDNLTEWRVTARGASAGPLVGEGRTTFATGKPVLVRADAPRFLVDGDTTTATGTVHSTLEGDVAVTVRLLAQGEAVSGSAEHQATLPPAGVQTFDGALTASGHGAGRFRAEALSAVESDAALVPLPVLPYGMRRLDGASGELVGEAFAELDLPQNVVGGTANLLVTLAPAVDVSLLESLAYTASYPWGCVEQTVNRFLPALAARRALGKMGSPAFRSRRRLDDVVERGLAALYSHQNDDGSFGWFGTRGPRSSQRGAGGDPEMTAYAVLGLVRAEHDGYQVSRTNRDRAIEAAKKLVRAADREDRAFLLYALSFAGHAGLEDLNALHRERNALAPRGLALLALAMQRTGRDGNALELVRLLPQSAVREDGTAHWTGGRDEKRRRFIPVYRDAEPTAYALLALTQVDPTSLLVDEAAKWLFSSRVGPAWRSTRDTAAAVEALAAHARLRGVERATGEVAVYVNGAAEPAVMGTFGGAGADPVDAPLTLRVPAEALRPGKNHVVLRRRGAGRVLWSALLSSVVRPAAGKSIEPGGVVLGIRRDYTEWSAPTLPGEQRAARIVPGWSVVVPEKRPKDWHGRPLDRAGTGDKVRVTLRVTTTAAVRRVIVEDALPAGFEVVPGSATGPFDREERRDDRQVFFVASLPQSVTLSYVLQAVHPGGYRALPATVRPMYEPELHAWSREHALTVDREPGVAGRAPSPEEITPDELWGLALRDFDREDWTAARPALLGLIERFELRPEIQEEAWARLFRIGLELRDAELTVKGYEEMTDRNPRRTPTDLRLLERLAGAYQELGEHERALVLYRDLVRAHFRADDEAAGAFGKVGDPWRRRDLLLAALGRTPDAPWAEAVELRLARETLTLPAPAAADAPPAGGPRMLSEGVEQLRLFQAHHAGSVLAHEAAHLTVQTLLQMDLSKDAIDEGTQFLSRHRASRYLDDVTYLVAEGHFAAGAHDDALRAARPLLTEEYPRDDDPKQRAASPFRKRAVHLTAKIAHLRGETARAAELYEQVKGDFPDAADALEFLSRKGLELREVETVGVGEAPALHLRRRNLPDVRLKMYAVDFMILYTLRRNLSAMNRIDLSGVRPVKEWTLESRGGDDLRWSDETVPLPSVGKGVYLVVARGGGLDASSAVLVSNLEVQVQLKGDRLRVYASNSRTGAPVGEVYVKVGDGSSIKAQGFTDARGVFEAAGVGGAFSVVAEKKGHVALWRR